MPSKTQTEIEALYERLVVNDCRKYIPSLPQIHDEFVEGDLRLLLLSGSMLALEAGSSREGARLARRAYDIATRLPGVANGNRQAIEMASDYILSQLGNFPGRQLLRRGDGFAEENATDRIASKFPFLALDILARESDNRTETVGRFLTDFQVDLLEALSTYRSVSFSAPTSAGKSTALEFEIVRIMRSTGGRLVILVPTRALIRQVTFDLVDLLNDAGLPHVPVLSAPDPAQITASTNVVCVFTQERLQTLLSNDEWNGTLDVLIVDEAQEIGEGARGQTLELTILQVLSRHPNCKLFFSSPLRSNPEFLLSTVGRSNESRSFVEHSAPVTQNIFLITEISRKPNQCGISLWLEGKERSLGVTELPFRFRGTKRIADVAVFLTRPQESSIIYTSGAAKAEELADQMASALSEVKDGAIDELVDFAKDQIHRDYHLAEVAARGVGFHYGKLPQIIRAKVEDLLRNRTMRFVACTSTLLQGVNLPTKNIFVENPRRGVGQAMATADFWNLVGRAGRLAKEFQGNIFCLDVPHWASNPFGETRFFPLSSAFEEATKNNSLSLLEIAKNPPRSSESTDQWAEQALARIFVDFTEQQKLVAESRYATPENKNVLQALDQQCAVWSATKTLPPNLYRKNPYLLPLRLDELANFFRNQSNLLAWLPPSPFVRRSYDRYRPIFQVIQDIFIRSEYDRHKYFTVLALQWMTGSSLKELIANRLTFRKVEKGDKREINNQIRALFEDIEDEVRYIYVKYFKIYSDVLRAVLIEQGFKEESERIPPIHLFLEYGAASQTLINLMGLGLSRTSAILLKSYLSLRDDLDAVACQRRVETVSLTTSQLPALCRAEIGRLRRSAK